MNTKEIIDIISAKAEISKSLAEKIIKLFGEIVIQGLERDGEVNWSNVGKWLTVSRKARTGVNPKTREKIAIPAKTSIKFKNSKSLKDLADEITNKK